MSSGGWEKVLSDPFSAQLSASSLYIALGFSLGLTIFVALLFSWFRPRHSIVYAPKARHADNKHAPPILGKELFAWFRPIWTVTEDEVAEKAGVDAAVFLRFTRMCRDLFAAFSIIGICILIPVHKLCANQAIVPQQAHEAQGSDAADQQINLDISLMTPQYVQGSPMWAHVVVVWCFDLIAMSFLWFNYRKVIRLRRNYFESADYRASLHSRTLWIKNVAVVDRSEDGLLRIADTLKQTSNVPRAVIGRDVKGLPEMVEDHDKAVRALESVLAKYLKNPDHITPTRPTLDRKRFDKNASSGEKVDAIDWLSERIKSLTAQIRDVRQSIDTRNPMPYGFVTYDTIQDAHSVASMRKGRKGKVNGASVRLAPKPTDFIWKNLPLSKKIRASKRFINNAWIVVLTVLWLAPNALIAAFLVNLSNITAVAPDFQQSLWEYHYFWSTVQAIAAPLILTMAYFYLPSIFRQLQVRAGDQTKTLRERHVMSNLYNFFVFNNLLVFSFFSVVFTFVSTMVTEGNQQDFATVVREIHPLTLVMNNLCKVSTFWITWLLQRNIGTAIDLAQLWPLLTRWFERKLMSPTPRQRIEWTAPTPFDYATYYQYFLFYATVALCYGTIQPLVLLATALFFTLDAWLKKYLLLYVFVTKTESGGQAYWKMLANRLFFAMIMSNVIAAVIILGCQGPWVMVIALAPAPIVVLAFKWYCVRAFDSKCNFYKPADLEHQARDSNDHTGDLMNSRFSRKNVLSERFWHPALHSTLIRPMVPPEAEALVDDRIGSRDDVNDREEPQIMMSDMSTSRPGKSAASHPDSGLFEVVPETRMDFSFFRNRPEFAEEHGGKGELEWISRAGTPASMMVRSDKSIYEHQNDSQRDGLVLGQQPMGYHHASAADGTNDSEDEEDDYLDYEAYRRQNQRYEPYRPAER